MKYFLKDIHEVFKNLNTSEKGLSDNEAVSRFEKHGPNKLAEKGGISLWQIILNQFTDPLVYILIAAAAFTVLVEEYIDTGVIIAVVIINAVIGFFQEYKAENAMQAIKDLAAPDAHVIRDGEKKNVAATEVVPGDICLLNAGSRVAADMRLFETKDLQIDESMLTGESEAVAKNHEVLNDEELQPADRENMGFMGTVVTAGSGRGVVVRTGTATELGSISEKVSQTEKEDTPLQKRLTDFSKKIGILSLSLAALVFLAGVIKGFTFKEMALFSIGMAVSVIPAGLPIVITVTMAIGLKRMAARQAIIRKLIAVETLGSCNYICSDKTGTITANKMTVQQAYAGGDYFTFSGEGYLPEGEINYRDHEAEKSVENNRDLYRLLR